MTEIPKNFNPKNLNSLLTPTRENEEKKFNFKNKKLPSLSNTTNIFATKKSKREQKIGQLKSLDFELNPKLKKSFRDRRKNPNKTNFIFRYGREKREL